MPQLDLYNFFIIICISCIGILIFFSYFQKHWLFSWKLLTIITFNVKNINKFSNVLLSKIFSILVYSFFCFKFLLALLFVKLHNIFLIQKMLLHNFLLVFDFNQLKIFY
jgi:hypothetical protein